MLASRTSVILFNMKAHLIASAFLVFAPVFSYGATTTGAGPGTVTTAKPSTAAKSTTPPANNPQEQKKIQTQNALTSLAFILRSYRLDCRTFPTTEQGLAALSQKPSKKPLCQRYSKSGYLFGKPLPKDAWSAPFHYASDGKTFTLKSTGNGHADIVFTSTNN